MLTCENGTHDFEILFVDVHLLMFLSECREKEIDFARAVEPVDHRVNDLDHENKSIDVQYGCTSDLLNFFHIFQFLT